ncbi:hypothetical protein C8A03DRAFT_37204 [Achaetomium macrosporum]|uniref:Uncharacterized protein n=1 Tax=Achaetomium macrosporum TaxID=79813 RepID=A0AAN7C3Z6_9PEZI|nr:hypothetical protein C8A03DRAFT_37204 [Achaetomium macrosporum]
MASSAELNAEFKKLKTGIKADMKGFSGELNKESGGLEARFQMQLAQSYFRSYFRIIATAMLLVGAAWVIPQVEDRRLDSEIKRRFIMNRGVDNAK